MTLGGAVDEDLDDDLLTEFIDLGDAMAKALTVDLSVVPARVLGVMTDEMNVLRNQMHALDARFVEAVDVSVLWALKGHANAAAYLRSNSNAHEADAAARVRRSTRLPKMRLVESAFRNGSLSTDHVRLLGELTERRWYARFLEAEAYLVQSAIELSWREFRHVIDIWKAVADPTEPESKDQSDLDAREFHLSKSFNDRGLSSGTFTPEARVIVTNELNRITKKLFLHDRAEAKERLGIDNPTSADLMRRPAQRRHDAIVIMARRSAGAEADADSAPPLVEVRASQACAEAALAHSLGATPTEVAMHDYECEFADGTPMSYSQLVRYMVGGTLHRVIVDQDGSVLDYGRGRRLFSKDQKAAIAWRDRFCACGCGLPANQCDADHNIEWDDGGLTNLVNGVARCRRSHVLKTMHNNRLRRQRRTINSDPDPPG